MKINCIKGGKALEVVEISERTRHGTRGREMPVQGRKPQRAASLRLEMSFTDLSSDAHLSDKFEANGLDAFFKALTCFFFSHGVCEHETPWFHAEGCKHSKSAFLASLDLTSYPSSLYLRRHDV